MLFADVKPGINLKRRWSHDPAIPSQAGESHRIKLCLDLYRLVMEIKPRDHIIHEMGCQIHTSLMVQGKMEPKCCLCVPSPDCGWPDRDNANKKAIKEAREEFENKAVIKHARGDYETEEQFEAWYEKEKARLERFLESYYEE